MKKIAALIAAAVLVPVMTVQGSASGASGGHHPTHKATTKSTSKPAARQQHPYRVKGGVTFNYPNTAPLTIQNKIVAALDHVGRHQAIRAMTWNFNEPAVTNALIRAHHRGASVRVIMARNLRSSEFNRLTHALHWHNKGRKPRNKSWTRTCSNSCRGRGGSEHSKWIAISKSGRSKFIEMEGSFNLTTSAVRMQWNDFYTTVGDKYIYNAYQKEFNQSVKDHPFPVFKPVHHKIRTASFAPLGKKDPVLRMLGKVHCYGAGRGSGAGGRTTVRIASAVIQQARGEKIAHRIKYLASHGCNVKVVYTLSTHTVLGILKGVRVHHMAWDNNGDGLYDRYLHMKAMSISGHYGKDHTAHMVFNSSANWSTMGRISDEQMMVINSAKLERNYSKHVDYLFGHSPPPGRAEVSRRTMRQNGVTDPYADIRKELLG